MGYGALEGIGTTEELICVLNLSRRQGFANGRTANSCFGFPAQGRDMNIDPKAFGDRLEISGTATPPSTKGKITPDTNGLGL